METICIKLEDSLLKEIDEKLKKHNYSTRSEFVRVAVRDKLKDLSREDLIKEFMKFRGSAKKKTSDKELREIREKVFKEFIKEKGWD